MKTCFSDFGKTRIKNNKLCPFNCCSCYIIECCCCYCSCHLNRNINTPKSEAYSFLSTNYITQNKANSFKQCKLGRNNIYNKSNEKDNEDIDNNKITINKYNNLKNLNNDLL